MKKKTFLRTGLVLFGTLLLGLMWHQQSDRVESHVVKNTQLLSDSHWHHSIEIPLNKKAILEQLNQDEINLSIPWPSLSHDKGLNRQETYKVQKEKLFQGPIPKSFQSISTYIGYGQSNGFNRVGIIASSKGLKINLNGEGGTWSLVESEKVDSEGNTYFIATKSNPVCAFDETQSENKMKTPPTQLMAAVANNSTLAPTSANAYATYTEPYYNIGDTLYQYTMAFGTTGRTFQEYFNSDTVAVLAYFADMINRINLVWMRELGSQVVLHPETHKSIFKTISNDGLYPDQNSSNNLGFMKNTFDTKLGTGTWDWSYMFDNNIGGGWSPVPGNYAIGAPTYEILIHEIGHSWGSGHNLSSNGAQAWSIGGTIMGSRTKTVQTTDGILNGDHYSIHSIIRGRYYQVKGIGHQASSKIATGNNSPVVKINESTSNLIPANTPFYLEGSATDAEDTHLVYSWEPNQLNPTFVSVYPTPGGKVRYFPNIHDLWEGTMQNEYESFFTGTQHFRLAVFDNNPNGGGMDFKGTSVEVANGTSSFAFTGQSYEKVVLATSVDEVELTWTTGNTENTPMNLSTLSLWLVEKNASGLVKRLAIENIPNTGSWSGTLPDSIAGLKNARLFLGSPDHSFFALGKTEYDVYNGGEGTFVLSPNYDEVAVPKNGKDTITFKFKAIGNAQYPFTLSTANLPIGLSASFVGGSDSIEVAEGDSAVVIISDNSSEALWSEITFQATSMAGSGLLTLPLYVKEESGRYADFTNTASARIANPGLGSNRVEFSFAGWVYSNGPQDDYAGFFSLNNWSVNTALNIRGGDLGFHLGGEHWSWKSGLLVPHEKWVFVAMVVDASGVTLYMDDESSTNSVPVTSFSMDQDIRLGNYAGANTRAFDGLMDEVSFWNKALSSEEIAKLRIEKITGDEEGLVAAFDFNQSTPSDLSSNGNSLSFTNSGTVGDRSRLPVFGKGTVEGPGDPGDVTPMIDEKSTSAQSEVDEHTLYKVYNSRGQYLGIRRGGELEPLQKRLYYRPIK